MHWEAYGHERIKDTVDAALAKNLNYRTNTVLGLPASFLDREEFYEDAPFLQDSPFLKVMVENPNHIGVHTLTQSETAFLGTQEIEVDLIRLCAEQIFGGEANAQDGYVAAGGTEANMEAIWVYRNFFRNRHDARLEEIAVIYSEDTHYSWPKGVDVFNLTEIVVKVAPDSRAMDIDHLREELRAARERGIKYLIVCMNMATTMFGSVDDIDAVGEVLKAEGIAFKIHVDGAFGGFIYPFAKADSRYTFQNPLIDSFTLDAHKMLQAPYGTGIFLIRKGYLENVCTEQAQYVHGKDFTLIGSRSGANAVAVWMIMRTHGSEGWKMKIGRLLERTSRLCFRLDRMGIQYYRHPQMNIVTIRAEHVPVSVAKKFHLVPDTHQGSPTWWKIVIMDHVTQGALDRFVAEIGG